MPDVEYLDEERKKIWAKIQALEEAINRKTTDDEKEAKQSSKKASEYKNKTQKTSEEAEVTLNEVRELKQQSEDLLNNLQQGNHNASEQLSSIKNQIEEINEVHSRISELDITQKLISLEEAVPKIAEINSSIIQVQNLIAEASSLKTKINSFHTSSLELKNEISDLHDDIYGYDSEDEETKKIEHVEGLKEKLETSYESLKKSLQSYSQDLSNFKEQKNKEYDDFIQKKEFEYSELDKKIKSLLPEAMTAGLSHAYLTKTKSEEEERKKIDGTFYKAIIAMGIISSIPFILGLILFFAQSRTFGSLVAEIPKLWPIMLPLYGPAFWVAASSSRKSNLSKRLIEEYTHKEVLSKTFEGLSGQVQEAEDEGASKDLKQQLLFNLINVSSENPGQLIKNFNRPDHPIWDIIDKSTKLTNAIEKCSNLPGFKSLAKIISEREHNIESKVQEGMEINQTLDSKEEK